MLGRRMQGQVCEAAKKMDLFLWIDTDKNQYFHLTDPPQNILPRDLNCSDCSNVKSKPR